MEMNKVLSTSVTFDSLLSKDNSDIINLDNYLDYLNDIIYDLAKDIQEIVYKTKSDIFGDLTIKVYIDEPIYWKDGRFTIKLYIYFSNEEFDDDFWYDNLKKDKDLMDFLIACIDDYRNKLNNIVKYIKHPINENLVFIDDKLYMEISPSNYKHTPEFIDFYISSTHDIDEQILDNLYVIN